MEKIGNPLVISLYEEIKKRKTTVPKVAIVLNIPKDRIYKWKQENSSPKLDDAKKIEAWIHGKVEEIPNSENSNMNLSFANRALLNLTESNKLLAESNVTLAKNNEELIEMVKATTADENPKNTAAFDTRYHDLLELIADVALGEKKWKSKQEALAELHKFSV